MQLAAMRNYASWTALSCGGWIDGIGSDRHLGRAHPPGRGFVSLTEALDMTTQALLFPWIFYRKKMGVFKVFFPETASGQLLHCALDHAHHRPE